MKIPKKAAASAALIMMFLIYQNCAGGIRSAENVASEQASPTPDPGPGDIPEEGSGPVELTYVVKDGAAVGTIVVQSRSNLDELYAAEELQIYIRKTTGATVPIVEGAVPSDRPAMIVGDHPAAQAYKTFLTSVSTNSEAFILRDSESATGGAPEPRRLFIFGNSPTGTLYGVWEYIEALGVRWFFPTEKGEYVKPRASIYLAPLSYVSAPAIESRGPGYVMLGAGAPTDANPCEHGKNALSDGKTWDPAAPNPFCDLRDQASYIFHYRQRFNRNNAFGINVIHATVGGHSYADYLPVRKYLNPQVPATYHPEWYLINGAPATAGTDCWNDATMTDTCSGTWQIEFTSAAAAAEFAVNARVDLDSLIASGYPANKMNLYVSPNDWAVRCTAGPCLAHVAQVTYDGQTFESLSNLVVLFANNVAAQIETTHPQVKISFLGYQNYAAPSTSVRPRANVIPELTAWRDSNSVGVNHSKPLYSAANPRWDLFFDGWKANGNQVDAYLYYGHHDWFTPWPQITQMPIDVKAFYNDGGRRMYSESHMHWGSQGLNLYLHPRLMWNPNMDVAKAIDEYYMLGFGPQAGPLIRQIFERLQVSMDSYGGRLAAYEVELPLIFTIPIYNDVQPILTQLQTVVPAIQDPNTRWRASLVYEALKESARFARAVYLYQNSRAASWGEIQSEMNGILAFVNSNQGKWAFHNGIAVRIINDFLNQRL